jgi:hypothetical protein
MHSAKIGQAGPGVVTGVNFDIQLADGVSLPPFRRSLNTFRERGAVGAQDAPGSSQRKR